MYQNISSAAESGWDFSGRWIKGNSSQHGLEEIQTAMLVPTDLNIFMQKNEYLLAEFFKYSGDASEKENYYLKQAEIREHAIKTVLKHKNESKWVDFDLGNMRSANRTFYISDLAPVWFLNLESKILNKVISDNEEILFKYPGGIPASEEFTGQQWDFPNVWAPVQQLFIDALLEADNDTFGEFYSHALNISQRFLNSVYCGYEMFGKI